MKTNTMRQLGTTHHTARAAFRRAFSLCLTALSATALMAGDPELPLDLGSAGDFVILAKTGISTVPYSAITGDMGVSPITATAITGFSLIMDSSGEFSTSAQVNGKIYAADYMDPTPVKMTTAISDMQTAYGIAAGRPDPDTTEFMSGNLSGQTMNPGLHKWSSSVLINANVTLDALGRPDAIFIFQIAGDLTMASYQSVILSGGAQAKNIFWQVGGGAGAIIGTYSHFEGIILTEKAITVNTGASFNGKLLAQTRVNLDQNNIVDADLMFPPEVVLEIVSAHGIGSPPVDIYTHAYGTLLTNSVTGVETIGGTQYVNVGWTMTGNDPVFGTTNRMAMVHTNDAVLTWQWATNYLLTASTTAGGVVTGDANGFYAAGSNVTVTAVPSLGYTFAGWTGNVSGPTNAATQNLTMDQARTLVARFAADEPPPEPLTLQIISAHGIGSPPVGIYPHAYGTPLANSVTGVETIGGTQYVNVGWTMTGNAPIAGTTNSMAMVHTNDAVLTWQWATNYLLTASTTAGGAVTGDANGFYAAGSNVVVTAVPLPHYWFVGWTGNVSGPTNAATQNLPMDQARTLVAYFAKDPLTLEIISPHGIASPPVGVYTHPYGTLLANSVTAEETIGGTQYVNIGWTMIGNAPVAAAANSMVMVHTNDAVLTWQWSTNYWLSLTATHGAITNATAGWKPAGWVYSLYQAPDPGYQFDHWIVNGVAQGAGVPLSVTMNGAQNVVAVFEPIFINVGPVIDWSIVWVFDPRKGYYIGTLTITNPSDATKPLAAPFWFEVQSTEWHWLRYPTGFDANTGMHYLDITPTIHALLPGIGDGDLFVDPGETVVVGGIQLMGRRTTDGVLMAIWADPPGTAAPLPDPNGIDTDGDGIPDVWESLHSAVLNASNPNDADEDADGDGVSNRDEYIAGTDPTDGASSFRIHLLAGGDVTWDGRPDRLYTVHATRDLRQGFAPVTGPMAGVGPETTYSAVTETDLGETAATVFYRVDVQVKTGELQ